MREKTFFMKNRKETKADSSLVKTKYSDQFFEAWLEYDSLIVVLDSLYPDYVNLKYRFPNT